MNRAVKLVLDIVIGAIIPIFILNNLNVQLGEVTTYIVAAFVPTIWIYIDLCFITKRFNIITGYMGTFAIVRGLLAFWFVDGTQFAIKDSIGYFFTAVMFGGSLVIHRPIIYYFLVQALNPDSPKQTTALKDLLKESKVYKALVKSTNIMLIINLLAGITNFVLNLLIVVAEFGTTTFNQQVAQVNAITQTALAIPELIGVGIAALFIRRAMFRYLPKEDGKEHSESDFWDLLQLRETQKAAANS